MNIGGGEMNMIEGDQWCRSSSNSNSDSNSDSNSNSNNSNSNNNNDYNNNNGEEIIGSSLAPLGKEHHRSAATRATSQRHARLLR